MAPSSAVARLVCLSIVRLRSVSSGSELTAAIRPRVFCCAPDKISQRSRVSIMVAASPGVMQAHHFGFCCRVGAAHVSGAQSATQQEHLRRSRITPDI